MSLTVTCDECRNPLRIDAADSHEPWLTCPRCLHAVRNPFYENVTAEPRRPATPELAAAVRRCDFCGEELKPSWRTCPACDTPVRGRSRKSAGIEIERDVRRDKRGSVIGLCVLGGFLLLGVIAFLAAGGSELVTASPEGPAVFGITLLVVAAVVIGIGCLLYFSKDHTAKAIGGTLGGVAAGVTIALGFVLLVIFAICAGINNFLNTCSLGGRPPH